MAVNPIGLNLISSPGLTSVASKTPLPSQGSSFWNNLQAALGQVDKMQQAASHSAQQLALGNEAFLHNTMIAYEKASLALELTIEIRNRLVESYQEIMRMQM